MHQIHFIAYLSLCILVGCGILYLMLSNIFKSTEIIALLMESVELQHKQVKILQDIADKNADVAAQALSEIRLHQLIEDILSSKKLSEEANRQLTSLKNMYFNHGDKEA